MFSKINKKKFTRKKMIVGDKNYCCFGSVDGSAVGHTEI